MGWGWSRKSRGTPWGRLAPWVALLVLAPLAAAADRDGDGIPDDQDLFPDHVTRAVGVLEGKRVIRGDRVGKLREDVLLGFHFFEGRRFALCDVGCRFGSYEKVKRRRYRLRFDRGDRRDLVDALEARIEQALSDRKGRVHDVRVDPSGARRASVRISKNGRKMRLRLLLEHESRVKLPKRRKWVDGALKIKASGPFSGFGP